MTSDPSARAGAILEIDLAVHPAQLRSCSREQPNASVRRGRQANGYGLGCRAGWRARLRRPVPMFLVATSTGDRRCAYPPICPRVAGFNGPFPWTSEEFGVKPT